MVDPLSGGPARLRELLARQATLHLVELPAAPTDDPGWILVEEGFTPAREHELESLFAIGNGYAGSRGSLAEGSALSAVRLQMLLDNLSSVGTEALARLGLEFKRPSSGVAIVAA